MSDYGSRYTDRRERILDLRLQRVYLEAQRDLQKKLDDFVQKKEKKNTEMLAKVTNKEITEEEYKNWLSGQVFQEKQWKSKVEQATETLLQSNRKAMTLIRDEQMNVFTENANFQAYDAEKAIGFVPNVSFELYDVASVDMLVREKPELLPRKTVNGRKDKAWNKGNIVNVITQGIIQGESIPQIAKRMARDTASKNMRAMTRYARTAMTGAQNAGRMETMHRAENMGITVKKQWLATLDSRTRDSHRHLDGEVRDIDDPFDSDFGKIMFPGDPSAHPGDVYNCRCTLVYVYPDFAGGPEGRRDQQTGTIVKDMNYDEWKDAKERKQDITFTETGKLQKVECPYPDEMSENGYVGLSGNESDEFIATHHNKSIIGKRGANTMDGRQSRRINEALRSGKMPENQEDVKLVQRLDSEIKKNALPQDMTLFRGVSLNAFKDTGVFDGFKNTVVDMSDYKNPDGSIDFDAWGVEFGKAQKKDMADKLGRAKKLIGTTIEDKGFMQVSASSQRNIFTFSDINIQIHTPEGTNAYISDYKEESEIILPRGTKLKILDATIATVTAANGNAMDVVQLIVELVE